MSFLTSSQRRAIVALADGPLARNPHGTGWGQNGHRLIVAEVTANFLISRGFAERWHDASKLRLTPAGQAQAGEFRVGSL